MSAVAELIEKAAGLSDEEKGELIVGVVGDMKALALKGLVEKEEFIKKIHAHFGIKSEL